MRLVIYLGEDNIKVVLGKCRKQLWVKSCRTYELPKGTLINDVITDQAAFADVLKKIAKTYHRHAGQVHLVLGSNKIITRVMKVPSMPSKSLLEIAKKELKSFQVNEEEGMVYDYGRLNQDTILCAAIQRKLAEGYCRLFRRCGLKVKTIDAALNSVAILAEILPHLNKQTYILAVLDGRNMVSSLYMKGKYIYTSRLRLVSERETVEICHEITRQMDVVRRFGESQDKEGKINNIYFCGLSHWEKDILYPSIKSKLGVDVSCLKLHADGNGVDISSYIYAAGNLISRDHKKCLDLISASKRKSPKEIEAKLKMAAVYALPLVAVLCFAGRYGLKKSRIIHFQKETAVIEELLNDPLKADAVDGARENNRKLAFWKDITKSLEDEIAVLEEYPQISGDVMKIIEDAGQGRAAFSDFSYDNGLLTFTAMVDELGEGAEFAACLEESGIFDQAGYRRMEKKDRYCFYMECTIRKVPERSGL